MIYSSGGVQSNEMKENTFEFSRSNCVGKRFAKPLTLPILDNAGFSTYLRTDASDDFCYCVCPWLIVVNKNN